MRYDKLDSALFITNRSKLGILMPPDSLAVIHAADMMPRNADQCYPYRQHSDMFYLTGIEQEGTILLLFPHHDHAAAREVLFILDPDETAETRFGTRLQKDEARQISGIQNVQWISAFSAWFHRAMLETRILFLNIYEYPKFSSEIISRDHRFARLMREQYPAHHFDRLAPLLIKLRMIKEEAELDLIRHAIDITASAFSRVATFIQPGLKEFEIEAEILHEFCRKGANGAAYVPIIASGMSACVLHYTANDKVCEDGDLILMDFGAEYANYASDLTRTLPVNGRFNNRQRKLYDAVHRVMTGIKSHFVPGNTIERINTAARLMMAEELVRLGLLETNVMKEEQKAAKAALTFMIHGITHHIGLDVHDLVDPAATLKPGMVMTCEPGLYLPEEGIGIRIENDILVANPPIDLMSFIPSEASQLEDLMNGN